MKGSSPYAVVLVGGDPADVPDVLRQAVLTLVAYWYANRDAVIITGTGAVMPAGLDPMLAPYRTIRL